ncbi:MAG: hypothetical protein KC620_11025 [Myxococcales bacterium]|nr:hypothetical protein [Myxococcales bacterium]
MAPRDVVWQTERVHRLISITLALQAAGVIVLLALWFVQRSHDDPSVPFRQLQAIIQQHGPVAAVEVLGPNVMHAASLACRREACIAERFGGNRGRWVVTTAAQGHDACESFQHPPCKNSNIRQALVRVLTRATSCEVRGTLSRGADRRVRVDCAGTQDFVTVSRDAMGVWRLSGDEAYPGFLPRLFDGRKP